MAETIVGQKPRRPTQSVSDSLPERDRTDVLPSDVR
jgi:hypothetical protein